MSRKTTAQRLISVLLAVVVLSFAFQVASHWHRDSYDDQQCQLCHFAHSISVDLSHGTVLPAPSAAHTDVAVTWTDPQLEFVSHQLSPRAPPASLNS
jgi:hypothetical protein